MSRAFGLLCFDEALDEVFVNLNCSLQITKLSRIYLGHASLVLNLRSSATINATVSVRTSNRWRAITFLIICGGDCATSTYVVSPL